MLQAESVYRRSWAGAAWLLAGICGALLTLVNLYAGVLLVALAMLGATATMVFSTRMRRLQATPEVQVIGRTMPPATTQRVVYTTDGIALQAIVVAVGGVDGYTTVLTTGGYKLVNNAGQIVYSLKQ